MPLITLKLIEGVYSQNQKQEMIKRMTDTMVDLEGEHMRPVTWVVIEEVKNGDWGVGGKAFSCTDVKALAENK
jgi:4-oxalocrotonate tautomerase